MGNVTESIFDSESVVIPMAEVTLIEKDKRPGFEDAISIVFKGSTWSIELDYWNNVAYLRHEEAKSFLRAWCQYRHELEQDALADLTPNELFPGTEKALTELGA